MKIDERFLTTIRGMDKLLKLCIKAKDMNSNDFYSLRNSWEKITDIYLNRKER